LKTARKGFKEALELNSKFNIREPFDKEMIKSSTAYIAPANYHLLVEYGHRMSLSVDRAVNHSRPSIDVTMETAAEVFKNNTLGVLLSGANMDGVYGMKQIRNYGGKTIVQNPEEAEIKTMPEAVLKIFEPDYVLRISKIIDFLLDLKD
jgi:two-component system chemotaxis response regulator CheB